MKLGFLTRRERIGAERHNHRGEEQPTGHDRAILHLAIGTCDIRTSDVPVTPIPR
jgi:hypothetical protein